MEIPYGGYEKCPLCGSSVIYTEVLVNGVTHVNGHCSNCSFTDEHEFINDGECS